MRPCVQYFRDHRKRLIPTHVSRTIHTLYDIAQYSPYDARSHIMIIVFSLRRPFRDIICWLCTRVSYYFFRQPPYLLRRLTVRLTTVCTYIRALQSCAAVDGVFMACSYRTARLATYIRTSTYPDICSYCLSNNRGEVSSVPPHFINSYCLLGTLFLKRGTKAPRHPPTSPDLVDDRYILAGVFHFLILSQ